MSTPLEPLETLFDASQGTDMPLGPDLARLYGALRFIMPSGRPWVIGNFVSTLDGVTAFDDPTLQGGGEISGYNAHDRMVMGLLRAVADAVVVGAGTLRADGKHIWTPDHIFRDLAPQFAQLRQALGLRPVPLNVFVTGRGDINFGMRIFTSGQAPVLIVTTRAGEARLRQQSVPQGVQIAALSSGDHLAATGVLGAIADAGASRLVVVEGGPHLMAGFFAEHKLDEMFLTLAPQLGGRDQVSARPGFVAGMLFAPHDHRWANLISVKRAESHLFLRYRFAPR